MKKTLMAFRIDQREKEGIRILDLNGRLTVGEGVVALRSTLGAIVEAGHRQVILNMDRVDYIDSTGLGALVVCFTRLQKASGTLKLLKLSRRSIELLVLTKLITVFELFNEEQEAVNSFFPDRKIKKFDILSFVQSQDKDRPGQ